MPGAMGALDTGMPRFTGEESTDEKVVTIQNYLFMLMEHLRYSLRNLDMARNMNQASVAKFTGMITEPIYGRIADAEGNITQLAIDARGLALRVSNAEGNITQLAIDAQGLALRVSNAEGNITQLNLTAQGLGVRVSNAEGNITSLTVTAEGLQSQVSAADGRITSLTQTVNGFRLTASNGSDHSWLYLSSGGINFGSARIHFDGVVTFTNLAVNDGRTVINGANISTGFISADRIFGGTISGVNINVFNDVYLGRAIVLRGNFCSIVQEGGSSIDFRGGDMRLSGWNGVDVHGVLCYQGGIWVDRINGRPVADYLN
jgi:YD repeat-containing protein